MNYFETIIDTINYYLWGWPMIALLLGTHIYLTIRLKFPQRNIFKAIHISIKRDKGATGDVSQFAALATALAATIGTGNIIGVATAVSLGGPGAVLWCWLTGVFGIATKYSEALLSVKYRVKTANGKMLGGPMYVLRRGLNCKWGAILFSVFTTIAALGIGNSVQSNAIATLCYDTFNLSPYITGSILTIASTLVLIFGVKGIARFCGIFVPFMAAFYIIGCIIILFINSSYVWEALKLICISAFTPDAAGGGFVGSSFMLAARFGVSRGLFSNESGLGSAPIVAAAAQTRNPVRQALVSSTGTFWDTVVVCALTGLVLVSSILAYPDISYSNGSALTKMAFAKVPYIGTTLLTVGLMTFAFSTILGWEYYGERALEYLGGYKYALYYRIVYILFVFIGSITSLSLVWNISDMMNALMSIPNIISLLLLSGILVKDTRKYLWEGHLDD
jgi:AGCS family alanine or glycine:cation symporter